jgi:hypothetical protein
MKRFIKSATLFSASIHGNMSLKTTDAKGICNIVFASQPIEKGKESECKIKNEFSHGEAVYSRCFFPHNFGKFNARDDEQFVVDLFIDKKFTRRITWKHPDNDWDQIQIYLINTGDDDFTDLSSHLHTLERGIHTILVTVGLERYMHTKEIVNADGNITKEDMFTLQVISKGEFSITL